MTSAETPGYEKLLGILKASANVLPAGDDSLAARLFLQLAGEQSSDGKGINRHGNDRGWMNQPILTIQRAVGGGFALGQAMKKIQEAERMPPDQAFEELKGAIVYLAGWCAYSAELWSPDADDAVEDPGKMAGTSRFKNTLRQVHQVMFCANGDQERDAGYRAIAAVAELAAEISRRDTVAPETQAG